MCGLSVGDVRFDSRKAILRVNGKGRKLRLVPLTGAAKDAIRAYRDDALKGQPVDAPFFTSHRQTPRRLTVPAIDYILRQNCALPGIDRINAHALRHTAASHAIEGGMPLHRVRDLLGHSSVLVTSRYLHVAESIGVDFNSQQVL